MGKGQVDDKHETTCGVIPNCVCLDLVDRPVRVAGSSAPCHWRWPVFELGHEPYRGSICSGG